MGFCLLVPHSQSELVQVTQGQILTTGREHAAHRCTGFPFVLHGHPGGMEKHHFRWDTSLNFYSAAELLLLGSGSHTRKGSLFSLPTSEWDKSSPNPAPCQLHEALSTLKTTCLQCHHHFSPFPASSNELPSQVCHPAMPPASYTPISSGILTSSHQLHIKRTPWDKEEPKNYSRPGNTGCASFLP